MLKSKQILFLLTCLLFVASATAARAQTEFSLKTSLHAHPTAANQTVIAATLTPAEGWYAYAPDPGNPFVRPPDLGIKLNGTPVAHLLPAGKSKPDPLKPGENVEIYDQATTFFVPLPPEAAGQTLQGRFTAVLCDGEKCILPRQPLEFIIPAQTDALPPLPQKMLAAFQTLAENRPANGTKADNQTATPSALVPAETPKNLAPPESYDWEFTPRPFTPSLEVTGLTSAVLLGLIAGLILNVMPCVLPVVSLKLSALMSGAAEEDERERQRRFREHNLFFGLGAMLWFGFLAALLGLGGFAWGELFQSAWVVGGLALILLLLALSLMGLFHLPVIDLKFDQSVNHPKLKALSTGMLATLLATPCSGPLLGGVLGWALLRPAGEVGIVFMAIGLGMASPYFLMIGFPGLVRFFPKPGAWLVHVEKAVALFLFAAVIYLISILPKPGGLELWPWLASIWCAATGIWLWRIASPGNWRLILGSLGIALAIGAPMLFLMPEDRNDPWTEFDPVLFQKNLGKRFMVLDFTADWCPTCKVLEATVLTDKAVREWSAKTGASFIRVDLSEDSPVSEALLKELGSHSIPLMALFPAGEKANSPIVIRDLFTAGQLNQALEQTKRESTQ